MTRLLRPISLYVLFLLVIVGCSPAGVTRDESSTLPVETALPNQDPPPGLTEAYQAPTLPTDPATPTVRAGLEASDPATFSLSSSELKLVEFFAFW